MVRSISSASAFNTSQQCSASPLARLRNSDDGICFGGGDQFQPRGNRRRDEKRDATILKQLLPWLPILGPVILVAVCLLHPGCNKEKKQEAEKARNSLIDALTPKP